jgi:hypothetical protein
MRNASSASAGIVCKIPAHPQYRSARAQATQLCPDAERHADGYAQRERDENQDEMLRGEPGEIRREQDPQERALRRWRGRRSIGRLWSKDNSAAT